MSGQCQYPVCSCAMGAMPTCRDYKSGPEIHTTAAPVVQPEPGDRAERWAKALEPWETFRAGDGVLSAGSLTAEELAVKGMALADAEADAREAAVRADLADQIIAERDRAGQMATPWAMGLHQGMTTAAALVRGQ